MKNVERLKIKGKKQKTSTCKLYIIDKAYRQAFLHKYKYDSSILDVIVFNLGYFDIFSFGGIK